MSTNDRCLLPPPGWTCSREPGHDGPCAARQTTRIADRPDSVCCLRCVTWMAVDEFRCPRCGTYRFTNNDPGDEHRDPPAQWGPSLLKSVMQASMLARHLRNFLVLVDPNAEVRATWVGGDKFDITATVKLHAKPEFEIKTVIELPKGC